MPNIKSAKKALRQNIRRRKINARRKEAMRQAEKELRSLLKAGKYRETEALIPKLYKAIDKAAKRGVIKKQTAARKKSRLARRIHARR